MGKGPLAGWERGHLTVSSQWAASPFKSLLKSVNWGMKAYQRAAVLRSDQRAACMGRRGVQLCACLDTVWMSSPVRRGGCWRWGVLGRWSMTPHEPWRASKNVAKLYSFSIKGWTERDQEGKRVGGGGGGRKKEVGHSHMPQLEKCKLAQRPDMWGMPQLKAQSARRPCRNVHEALEESWKWRCWTCLDSRVRDQANLFIHFLSPSPSATLSCWLSVLVSLK